MKAPGWCQNGKVTASSPAVRPRRRDEILRAAAGLFATEGYRSTSMREVAAAAGILAGSLYHHFPSKEAIAVELVEQYHADLDRAVRDFGPREAGPVAALRAFARVVAEVSGRNRAALHISMYDAPTSASPALRAVVRAQPASLDGRWRDLISAAAAAGAVDGQVDPRILRHVLRETMPKAGVMVWERGAPAGGPAAFAECVTSVIFDGLAAPGAVPAPREGAPPEPGGKSPAIRAVSEARARWAAEAEQRQGERSGLILDVARSEFAQHGFEATTVRDIADAAGLSPGNLYRYFESKDAMVRTILSEFSDRLLAAYTEVLAAGAGAVESIEAICWLLDQAGRHFSREIDMLKGNGKVLSLDVASHYRDGALARYAMLVSLIERGAGTGELRPVADPALTASCVREIMWAPMRSLALVGAARVREFIRHAILAGAAVPARN
jgi:AcrR family transcriptional regulator